MRNEGRVENWGAISKGEERGGADFCPGSSPQAHHRTGGIETNGGSACC